MQLPDAESTSDALFEVDEDNWPAVMVFCKCATQWRFGAMGGVTGMDYSGVKVVLDLTPNIDDVFRLFDEIQVMERAALAVMNEKAK